METGWLACTDENTLQYGKLCNIAGGAYYELNKLGECRRNWDKFMKIQESLLPEDDLEVTLLYVNIGP